eukprot:gene9844-7730_t
MQIATPTSVQGHIQGTSASDQSTASSVATPSSSSKNEKESGAIIGVSWQINKNWAVKCRVGDASAAAAVALRSWSSPSFMLYSGGPIKFGLKVQLENMGALRYERGTKELRGRTLIQRHVASGSDLANLEGDTSKVVAVDAAEEEYSPLKSSSSDASASFL